MSGKKRILVVDDEPDFVAVVQRNLEWDGFQVEVAYDGKEGLKKVTENPPDAIVLDVIMPEEDGYELCSELKENDRFADIPIIMLTAVASSIPSTRYSHYDGMTMDADDYLVKPASAEQIIKSLKRVLKI